MSVLYVLRCGVSMGGIFIMLGVCLGVSGSILDIFVFGVYLRYGVYILIVMGSRLCFLVVF